MFTPYELARKLKVPIATLYKWNSQGTGPRPLHLGRHVRYTEEEVDRWLDERAAKARAR